MKASALAGLPITNQTVLAILPAGEDRAALEEIFAYSTWTVLATITLTEAYSVLKSVPVGVVIAENRFPGGESWKDLLCFMQETPNPPPLIVAANFPDDRLWAEALNLGAFDVLAKPFKSDEVRHVCESAWHSPAGL